MNKPIINLKPISIYSNFNNLCDSNITNKYLTFTKVRIIWNLILKKLYENGKNNENNNENNILMTSMQHYHMVDIAKNNNYKIEFIEMKDNFHTIDIEKFKNQLVTFKPSIILITNIFGQIFNVKQIKDILKEYDLNPYIIEDCAQVSLEYYDFNKSVSDIQLFSFGQLKQITTGTYGACVFFNNTKCGNNIYELLKNVKFNDKIKLLTDYMYLFKYTLMYFIIKYLFKFLYLIYGNNVNNKLYNLLKTQSLQILFLKFNREIGSFTKKQLNIILSNKKQLCNNDENIINNYDVYNKLNYSSCGYDYNYKKWYIYPFNGDIKYIYKNVNINSEETRPSTIRAYTPESILLWNTTYILPI